MSEGQTLPEHVPTWPIYPLGQRSTVGSRIVGRGARLLRDDGWAAPAIGTRFRRSVGAETRTKWRPARRRLARKRGGARVPVDCRSHPTGLVARQPVFAVAEVSASCRLAARLCLRSVTFSTSSQPRVRFVVASPRLSFRRSVTAPPSTAPRQNRPGSSQLMRHDFYEVIGWR